VGYWLHFILIVTLYVLLIISDFSTTCQVTLIGVLVYYRRLSVDSPELLQQVWKQIIHLNVILWWIIMRKPFT